MSSLEEKTLETRKIYEGKIINLRNDMVLLPNGQKSQREVVEHPGGVCVAAVTDDNCLLFVRQFRYPYKKEILELPAGKLNPGEDPLTCGKRELKEETGATASNYISLGRILPSPGYTNEVIYLYLATDLSFGDQQPDEDEFLDVLKISLNDTVKKILSGEICDAKTQVAVLRYYIFRTQEKAGWPKMGCDGPNELPTD